MSYEREAVFTRRVSTALSCQSSISPPSLSGTKESSAQIPPQQRFNSCSQLTIPLQLPTDLSISWAGPLHPPAPQHRMYPSTLLWPQSWCSFLRVSTCLWWETILLHVSGLLLLFSRSVMFSCLWSHGLKPTRLLSAWDFPGKNTGVGCHFLF